MKISIENGTTVFSADEGMVLTDGTSYVSTVRLGKEDYGMAWSEMPISYYEEHIKPKENNEITNNVDHGA